MFSLSIPQITPWGVISVIVIGYVTYFVLSNFRRFQHWKKQKVPEQNPWLTHFHLVSVLRQKGTGLGELHLKMIRDMGSIFGINNLKQNNLFVADAEALKHILVRDFNHFMDRQVFARVPIVSKFLTHLQGQEWRHVRSIISPTFTSGKIKAMFPLMQRSLDNMIEVFEQNIIREIDVFPVFGNFTMDTIAKVAFAVETNTHKDPLHPFVVNAKDLMNTPFWKVFLVLFSPRWILEKLEFHFFGDNGFDYCTKLAKHIIEERQKSGVNAQQFPDFLQLMLEARQDENGQSEETLTDEQVIANTIFILLAGYHTTSVTLTFAVYSLAVNPDVQDRVRQEIRDALANSKDGQLDYDVLNSLTYLDAVISETLRLYPPVTVAERTCSEDYVLSVNTPQLGSKEIIIPKGTGVFLPIWAVHHMEEYYAEASKFKPERWLPENKDQLVPYTYLAFMTGPRNCAGMRFALLELKLALATIISRYQIKPTRKTKLEYGPNPFALIPKEVVVSLEKILS